MALTDEQQAALPAGARIQEDGTIHLIDQRNVEREAWWSNKLGRWVSWKGEAGDKNSSALQSYYL